MDRGTEENRSSIGHYVIRLLLTTLVLAVTSFLTGFQ